MAINRRNFVHLGTAGLGAGIGFGADVPPAEAAPSPLTGALDATQFGVIPGLDGNQGPVLQLALNAAAKEGMPLFLAPGRYLVSDLILPGGTYLVGVPGRTTLLFAGGTVLAYARSERYLTLSGITFAGAGNKLTGQVPGLLYLRDIADLNISGCVFDGSSGINLVLEYVSGRVAQSTFVNAGESALLSLEARGLEISGNVISDCANNGIEVWRSETGEDGTLVTNNRISRIRAAKGGSGENGNGVSVFRAGAVTIANNRITDCAFSAVRCNAAHNAQVVNNSCARLGEVALYSEFGFEGAIVSSNLIDGAATGISITNFDHGGRLAVCSGNLVRNLAFRGDPADPESRGTGISVEADTIVANNIVEGAPRSGLQLGWGKALRDVSATGNVIRDAGIGIAVSVAAGAGKALVTDNLMSGITEGAVVGMEWNKSVTQDLTAADTLRFPHLTLGRNDRG